MSCDWSVNHCPGHVVTIHRVDIAASKKREMAWSPDEASLTQIVQLLRESQASADTETQRSVEQVKLHY